MKNETALLKFLPALLLLSQLLFGCKADDTPPVESGQAGALEQTPSVPVEWPQQQTSEKEEAVEIEVEVPVPNEKPASTAPPKKSGKTQDKMPVLKNLGVDIAPWDKKTNLAGDLMFTKELLFEDANVKNEHVFVEFGGESQRKNDPNRNIEYWFYVPIGTEVVAPTSGVVDISFFEHTKDWGINFRSSEYPDWIVSFEHVVDLKVKTGDFVAVGEPVAKAAPRIGNKVAMVELAVWQGGRSIYKHCPFNFLEESLKPVYEEKIRNLALDWEKFVGMDVYRQEDWVAPGCLLHNITER